MTKRILIALLLAICISGCATNEKRINHIVLCWLKDPGNEVQRQTIIDASESFKEIPGVINVSAGNVIMSERSVVNDSYDVGIHISFANTNDMNSYIDHPLHQQTVRDTLSPLARRIVVLDF